MKFKVKFSPDGRPEIIATFDTDAGAVTTDTGMAGTAVLSADRKSMQIKGEQNIDIVFASEPKQEVGHYVRYTASNGDAGVATFLGPV